MEFVKSFSCSFIASTIVYPIELIKTQFQRTIVINPKLSVFQLISNIYKTKRLLGFFRGLSVNLLTYPIFWGIYFQANKIKWNVLNENNKLNIYFNKSIKSIVASTISSTCTNPLFVIRTRFQLENINLNNAHEYKKITFPFLIKNIIKKEGFLGFFKGLGSTIFSNFKLCLQLPLYDYLAENNNVVVSSFIAKIVTSTIFYPFDLIRANQRGSINKLTITGTIKKIIKNHGIKGIYKGVGLYNLVTAPNFIIMMFLKEYF